MFMKLHFLFSRFPSVLRSRFWKIIFITFFGSGLELLGLGLVIPLISMLVDIDAVFSIPIIIEINEMLGISSPIIFVIVSVALVIFGFLFKALYLGGMTFAQSRYVHDCKEFIGTELFSIYLSRKYDFYIKTNSGVLLRNLTTEINQATGHVLQPSLILFTELSVVFAYLAVLFFFMPAATCILIGIFLLASYLFSKVTKKKFIEWGGRRQRSEAARMQSAQQGFGSIRDLIIFGRASEAVEKFALYNHQVTSVEAKQYALGQLPRLYFEFLGILCLGLLVIFLFIGGKGSGESLPILGLFAIAAFRMMPSGNRIIGAFNSLRYAAPIIDVLHEEFIDKTLLRKEEALSINTFSTISLTDVSYQYPGAKSKVLNNVTVTINRGTVIGIVGASGSGKSTLMDLILGLLLPQEGSIKIDGLDVIAGKVNYKSLFGYVPQSVYLNDDSLRNNIAFGVASDNICEEALNNAIDTAQLRGFVKNSPLGDRVLLGDRGAKMSEGQKQRVGIARALYNNPQILCFDEASSALDSNTETALMDAINDLRGSLTIVMVAHRLSTLSICDEVYEVKSGCVTRKNINDIYVK